MLMDIFEYENKKQNIGYGFSCGSKTDKFWSKMEMDRKTSQEPHLVLIGS